MSPKSNVYISVTRAPQHYEESYRRTPHNWLLSIEPHSFHVPGTHKDDPEPIHYAALEDEDGFITVSTRAAEIEPAIIGNVLIAENAHVSPEQFHALLEEVFGRKESVEHRASGQELEHWIREAVRKLQERKMIEAFNVSELITFTHGYEAVRLDSEGESLVAYPKIKGHENKSSKHKFWITRPMEHRTKRNTSGHASTYGGLM
jgi:hypothetical protein